MDITHDYKKGTFTDNFNAHTAKYVWFLNMYMLAAFLIISLIKIKRVLPSSEFKPQSMIIHIVSLSL